MKKKELAAMRRLRASEEILDVMRNDHDEWKIERWGLGYESKFLTCRFLLYFRAEVEKEILKVFVFSKKWLLAGNRDPEYIIFLDKKKEEFLTLDTTEDKWKTAKIDMLHYDTKGYSRFYSMKNYQSENTRRIVNSYLGTGNLEVKKAVLDFQCEIRGEELRRKHKRETEAIDEVMNEVPELPKNFEEWIRENCFKETLFYKSEKAHKWPKVYCTHCKNWFPAPLEEGHPKHGKRAICPNCKTVATYRSWNKQKYVFETAQVAVIQKLQDKTGYVLRKIFCRLERNHEKGWENAELFTSENLRVTFWDDMEPKTFYTHEEYKNTGVVRWCYAKSGKNWNYYRPEFGPAQMYTHNMKQVFEEEQFGNINFEKIFSDGQKKDVYPTSVLKILKRHPYLEYLEKSGLTKLVKEILQGKEDKTLFKHGKKNIYETCGLDKQRFNRLKKVNGGSHALAALQYEKRTGDKVTDEHLRSIEFYMLDVNDMEMHRTNMSLQKTVNFLKRQMEITGYTFSTIEHYYSDYLDMAEARGMDITDEIVCKNAKMMEFHNKYLEEENRKKNEKKDEQKNKEFREIETNYEVNKAHFFWENEEYMILVPKRASDIMKEGRLQHHCVGASDTYMKRMNEKKSFILFLRRKADEEIPYYTLEAEWDGTIKQAYSAYDRKPDYKELVEPILKEFKKIIMKRMLEESMAAVDERLQDNVQMLSAG